MMYPSAVDRYRLLSLILRSCRESSGMLQKQVAYRSGLSPATVSNLEHLDQSVAAPQRRVSRQDLIQVATWGLELPQETIDTLLWLYDGKTLSGEEIRRWLRGYQPDARPHTLSWEEGRCQSIALLERVAANLREGPSYDATVTVYPSDLQSYLVCQQAQLDEELIPGQRLVVTAGPSFLLHLPEHSRRVAEEFTQSLGPVDIGALERITRSRLELFMTNTKAYGHRAICDRGVFERHFTQPEGLPVEEFLYRLKRLQHIVRLVECPDLHFEMRLDNHTPSLEWGVKNLRQALMFGAPRSGEYVNAPWGIQYIQWKDERTVVEFVLQFEHRWGTLGVGEKASQEILAELREIQRFAESKLKAL